MDLKTGYVLLGFEDFESALSAADRICARGYKVAYLNEVACMRELEVREFVRELETEVGPSYRNYQLQEQKAADASESLKTALATLEKRKDRALKFIMVVGKNVQPRRYTWGKKRTAPAAVHGKV
ncbi:hypothetical protein [Pontibacter roseus]|uniref:hypothetical protein n=1 Tax=Pontibacter roseus TaxID=336989 RepID=UPI0003A729EE|nr:hypothetical protein [Pontibacter roseus]